MKFHHIPDHAVQLKTMLEESLLEWDPGLTVDGLVDYWIVRSGLSKPISEPVNDIQDSDY